MSFADSYLGRLRAVVGTAPLIAVGVRLLVENGDGRFLTIRRSDDLKWGLPGGAMELGESLIDAAHRETFEETNVRLTRLTPFGLSSDPVLERHTYPGGDMTQNVSLLVHGFAVDGPIASNDGEALEFRYCREGDLDETTFSRTEYPTFAHWRAFEETGVFQIV